MFISFLLFVLTISFINTSSKKPTDDSRVYRAVGDGKGAYESDPDGFYGFCGSPADKSDSTSVSLCFPKGIWRDAGGVLYIADQGNHLVRKVSNENLVSIFAGEGVTGYSNGLATASRLSYPYHALGDNIGNIFISDTGNQRVRKVNQTGILQTIVGSGADGYSGDGGDALAAALSTPKGMFLDSSTQLFFAEYANCLIRKVNLTSGIISTVAGLGSAYCSASIAGDAATSSSLLYPSNVWANRIGNIFTLQAYPANAIAIISHSNGKIYSFGSSNKLNYRNPRGVWGGESGDVYVADTDNNQIRVIKHNDQQAEGGDEAVVIVGDGNTLFKGDFTDALRTGIKSPQFVYIDPAGFLFYTDNSGYIIRVIAPTNRPTEAPTNTYEREKTDDTSPWPLADIELGPLIGIASACFFTGAFCCICFLWATGGMRKERRRGDRDRSISITESFKRKPNDAMAITARGSQVVAV